MHYIACEFATDGTFWALDANGHALRFVDEGTWVNDYPTKTFKSLSVGGAGQVVATDGKDLFHFVLPSAATQISNDVYNAVAAASDGTAMAVDVTGAAVIYNRVNQRWDPIYRNGTGVVALANIGIGKADVVYGVSNLIQSCGGLVGITDQAWSEIDTGQDIVCVISTTPDRDIWYVGNGIVFRYTAGRDSRGVNQVFPTKALTVSVGSPSYTLRPFVWAWDGQSIYALDPDAYPNQWNKITAPYAAPALAADGSAFAIDNSDAINPRVMRYEGTTEWTPIPTGGIPMLTIASAGENEFFGLGHNKMTYHWQGLYWKQMQPLTGRLPVAVSAGHDGTLAVLDDQGKVWIGVIGQDLWDTTGGPFTAVSVGNSKAVYALDSAGAVHQWNSTNGFWSSFTALPEKAEFLSVTDDGVPYVVLKSAALMYVRDGNWTKSEDEIDGSLAYFSARDAYHICGVVSELTDEENIWMAEDEDDDAATTGQQGKTGQQMKAALAQTPRVQLRMQNGPSRFALP